MSYQQGGPPWGPVGPQTPDWSALAAEAEQKRRRKRLLLLGGGVAATLAVGALIALAIVNQGNGDGGQASDGSSSTVPDPTDPPPDTARPEPTFEETDLPAMPKMREFITDADLDTAAFDTDSFYAGDPMVVDGREYAMATVHGTDDCAEGGTPAMGGVLAEHDCGTLLRATYVGSGVAVTVGVAQFGSKADAQAAKEAVKATAGAYTLPLVGGDAPNFCQRGGCRTTSNFVGRYAYFTIAGNSDGSPDSGEESPALQAARDGNDHAFTRVIRRGESQASASASARVAERRRNN